jgi:hypothetical protein
MTTRAATSSTAATLSNSTNLRMGVRSGVNRKS